MNALEWLFKRSPAVTGTAPEIIPVRNRRVLPPVATSDELEETAHVSCEEEIDLDEAFVAIEYEDAAGNETRRRITMRKLSRGPNAPIVTAICHERHAIRHFRTDRIGCIITKDGEIIDTGTFFRDTLGIDLADFRPDEGIGIARLLRERLRPPVSILVAAARSDGQFLPVELDAIERFIEDHIAWMLDTGRLEVSVTPEHLDKLRELVRTMRPSRGAMSGYLTRVMEFETYPFQRFLRALEEVIAADGVLHRDEFAFLDEISQIRHPETGLRLSIVEWSEWEE